jgi:hypothetical protein
MNHLHRKVVKEREESKENDTSDKEVRCRGI